MAKSNNTLCLDKFYPEKDLMITDIAQQSDKIIIRMKSTSSSCKCPKCNHITQKYHGTYTRKVQDLPILGKNVNLKFVHMSMLFLLLKLFMDSLIIIVV